MKLSVILPVYNESATLEEIVRRIQGIEYEKEIVAVDDASSDGSRDILQRIADETIM